MKSTEKIISAFENLLKKKSMQSITVNEIVELAGISRKTFYRNFKDKYDLLHRYFDEFYNNSFGTLIVGNDFYHALDDCLKIYEEKRVILRNAYESEDINGLKQHDIEITKRIYYSFLEQKGIPVNYMEIEFAIDFASRGGTEIMIEWIKGNIAVSRTELTSLLIATLPEEIKKNL